MGDNSFIFSNLLTMLKEKNITTLARVRNLSENQSISSYWLSASDLGLEGDIALEWKLFRSELAQSDVLI
jgi:hypothetical protein